MKDNSDYSGDVCTACSKRGPCCWSSTQGEWNESHLVCDERCESVLFKQLHCAKLDGGCGGKKRDRPAAETDGSSNSSGHGKSAKAHPAKKEEEVEHKRLEQVRSKLKIEKVVNCVAILVVIIVKIHFLSSFVENVAHCVTDTRL